MRRKTITLRYIIRFSCGVSCLNIHKNNMCFLCREALQGSIFPSKLKLFEEDNLDAVTHLIMGIRV